MPNAIAIVLKGYPRLSETFIAQEIRALELRGFRITLVSLRHPYDPAIHPIHREISASVHYLPEYVGDDPGRVIRAWWQIRRQTGYATAFRQFFTDLRRDPSVNRVRRFAQAMVMAAELPTSIEHYYAHFMHTPASVTRYASAINGVPWTLSAHAKDIWTLDDWEKREKLASAEWTVTCTAANVDHLKSLADDPDKVSLVYHGLDFSRFPDPGDEASGRDGSDAEHPVRLLSVGRAVDKKGYNILLDALAGLPADRHWKLIHIGKGELLQTLKLQAERLGIGAHIDWLGALPQESVLGHYRDADLFVLPSKISSDGDRDGLPNVLMEALSQRLACLSTRVSGIPELLIHGESGWLIPEKNTAALTAALESLIADPARRTHLANAGFDRLHSEFSLDIGIDLLTRKLSLG